MFHVSRRYKFPCYRMSDDIDLTLKQVYATIKEVSSKSVTKTVCKSSTRERHVYTSRTSAVEIRVVGTSPSADKFFLLRYEGLIHNIILTSRLFFRKLLCSPKLP